MRTVGSNVPDGNDSHSLVTLYWKQPLDSFHIIVAYLTRAEPTVSSSEAEMLHGNTEVDVAMILVVVRAHPSVIEALEAQHEHRNVGEPRTVVTLSYLLLAFIRRYNQELPWLEVVC